MGNEIMLLLINFIIRTALVAPPIYLLSTIIFNEQMPENGDRQMEKAYKTGIKEKRINFMLTCCPLSVVMIFALIELFRGYESVIHWALLMGAKGLGFAGGPGILSLLILLFIGSIYIAKSGGTIIKIALTVLLACTAMVVAIVSETAILILIAA